MRFKVPFFGLSLAIGGLFILAGSLVAALPFLIDSRPVRDHLVAELTDWTGGEVTLSGNVAISSLFSISVEATALDIRHTQNLAKIANMSADRIVARLSWSDLAFGNVSFDKIKIYGAAIEMETADLRETAGAVLGMLSGPKGASFATMTMTDSVLALRTSARAPFQRLHIESVIANARRSDGQISASGSLIWRGEQLAVSLRRGGLPEGGGDARTSLRLQIDGEILHARFDGESSFSGGWSANGTLAVSTPDAARLTDWLGGPPDHAMRDSFGITGALDLGREELNLRDAELSFGGQTASGDLTMDFHDPLPRLGGSLAFAELNLDGVFANGPRSSQIIRALVASLTSVDLRISADSVRVASIQTGTTAFTLAAQPGKVSIELADLSFLDGAVHGQIQADVSTDPVRTQARLSAENLNAATLLELFNQRDWLTGRADADIEAEMEWNGTRPLLEATTARARVTFAEGGQIRLDIPRTADAVSASAMSGWEGLDFTRADFNELRFKLMLENGQLRCDNLELSSAGDVVNGVGQINLQQQSLNWRFTVVPLSHGEDEVSLQMAPASAPPRSSLSITGALTHPVIGRDSYTGAIGGTIGGAITDASATKLPVAFEAPVALEVQDTSR